ncbi:hypothetical protein CLAFUW4_06307 [Fulvia fulva]|uniref:Uncharacterized protein n=1 Tax=Passalora fulva TaxID=5499 RepID=A0A9Q8LHP7_PASFU|nr:uncharacterized protein CLAFUR5_06451 [Fulvia fulva]KAK4624283.1 hypothetical protein CLAFUR4_06310 [Fulvia fulva]KAK4625060.1 hypothetical protein CLAFUR0_06314 [Fulvia fulva]UJO17364.1 hypothetical protein CLAFUR5_06451 [Fulvia fulva]WPV14565.1 hypothetical protein CLAFUW4_06307 [Fulvia fulva]WPV29777.1 hypothetical protein CLAFUW7_06305 [Fulvia fulva]
MPGSSSDGSASNLISHDTIRQHCSDIIHGFFEMINTRQFDTNLGFWTLNIASNYTYAGLHGDIAAYDAVDLAGHLKNFEGLTKDVFPDFRLEVVDVWTEMNMRGEDVRTFMNWLQVNCPPGIVKPSAAEIKWRREEGRLQIWEVRTMGGGAV